MGVEDAGEVFGNRRGGGGGELVEEGVCDGGALGGFSGGNVDIGDELTCGMEVGVGGGGWGGGGAGGDCCELVGVVVEGLEYCRGGVGRVLLGVEGGVFWGE